MNRAELHSGGNQDKDFADKMGWYGKWGGYGAAVAGAFFAPALVIPGLLLGTGGLILENRPKSGK
jgi:hypothetical protein